ncbi:WbqC-like protein family protein [compost metagenome]
MKLAIMQPYFLPYIGYFQLIASVDKFVVYDNIKYTKKGWINRNRMLKSGTDTTFSLALKNDSDSLDIRARALAENFNREKLLNQFSGAYRKAPYFEQTFPVLEEIVHHDDDNLFRYLHHSIVRLCGHLSINTDIQISSSVPVDHDLKGADKVMALCNALGASTYINSIGGTELYDRHTFQTSNLTLRFLRSQPFQYRQFDAAFVPWLSIVDVMMFNPLPHINAVISGGYELI